MKNDLCASAFIVAAVLIFSPALALADDEDASLLCDPKFFGRRFEQLGPIGGF